MTEDDKHTDLSEDENRLFEELFSEDLNNVSEFGAKRRLFLKQVAVITGSALAYQMFGGNTLFAGTNDLVAGLPPSSLENAVKVSFNVNGVAKSVEVDSRMTLLDTLRERLELTGSKKGCDHGQCGACTVIVDGKRVLSCLTLAACCEGKSVTSIEGLAKGSELHPMQSAFVKHDGFQCGYCTPGQICSAVALLEEAKAGEASYVTADVRAITKAFQLSDEEIRERMSGNICRCGAYPNIVTAIREVQSGKDIGQTWQFSDKTN